MNKLRFFKCNKCEEVIVKLIDKDAKLSCCGEEMKEILANTVDASLEKHMPVVNVNNGFVEVKVGSVLHPMEEAHYINFIAVETENGYSVVTLTPNQSPEAKIYVGKNKVIAVYEYCSLHGLWKVEI